MHLCVKEKKNKKELKENETKDASRERRRSLVLKEMSVVRRQILVLLVIFVYDISISSYSTVIRHVCDSKN